MVSVAERIPERLRGPASVLSLGLGILGVTVGYVVVLWGLSLVFDMQGYGAQITTAGALAVVAGGVACLAVGYAGWRGFMRIAT